MQTTKDVPGNPIASDGQITELDYYNQSQMDSGHVESG